MDVRLDGRSALITGGSLGLGKAMALKFAESGADVAIIARRQDVLDEARMEIEAVTKNRVIARACDVTDAAAVEDLVADVNRELGKIDILVNNAGSSMRGKFEEVTDEMWRADFDLKLFAAIRLIRLVFPAMKERRWGRILNVLNVGAKAPLPGSAPTSVTRAAGMAMSKVVAGEGAPYNVLVNALCTGQLVSDQWVRRHSQEPGGMTFDEWLEKAGKAIPLGRLGEAEEFANMACFLASDAGGYITGTAINIDGGKSPVV